MRRAPLWQWLAFPGIAMSLGWALRGFIGGGPLGAMIPGAMVGLVLCLLLRVEPDAARVAAFAAVGFGFGGEMTYGQTVGLSLQPETYWWALLGFAVKGAVWGLLGGIMIGIALVPPRRGWWDVLPGLVLLVAGTWAGWKLINEPKLIYFSNRLDRPRPEIWAGLLAGGLMLVGWLALRGSARLASQFGVHAALAGGIGFALGAAIQVWGTPRVLVFPLGWWKVMELTFGAMLGLGLGLCAWRHRYEFLEPKTLPPGQMSFLLSTGMAAVAIGLGILLDTQLHTRFNYVIAGAALLGLALFSRTLCWQVALTLTCCAFALDLVANKPHFSVYIMRGWVAGLSLATVSLTSQSPRAKPLLLWLTWTAVATSLLKSFLPFKSTEPLMMEGLFVAMAMAVTRFSEK